MILILIGIGSRKLHRIHSHIYNTVNSQIFPTHVALIRTLWNLQYFPNPPLKPTHWLIVVNTLIAFNLLSLIAGTRDTSWHKIWINTSKTESRFFSNGTFLSRCARKPEDPLYSLSSIETHCTCVKKIKECSKKAIHHSNILLFEENNQK